MSQDSREKFGVKSQISIGGAVVGGERRREKRERICWEPDKVEVVQCVLMV